MPPYRRFWSLYSKLHKFEFPIVFLFNHTIGFSLSFTTRFARLHKLGLPKTLRWRLRFWSLAYRTYGSRPASIAKSSPCRMAGG